MHPGRAFLDEQIRISNPTDGMHPYYFWNCTAFPNNPGTRFIYPMSLGTDHNAREFFQWPIHEGRDLSWLKNYDTYASIFAVDCPYDFFGAYDVDADRGIVQVANHHELGGKKAWTWGEWEFGKVAQQNLTDNDGPYIEVQSGPLPTQSDYGMLGPREKIQWREWWYPVHGLGDGFEYATKDVAIQVKRNGKTFELRMLATGRFPQSSCTLQCKGRQLLRQIVDLSPLEPVVISIGGAPQDDVAVTVSGRSGKVLANFTTPLPMPDTDPPLRADYLDEADDQLSAESLYLKGRKQDRETDRRAARNYYQLALRKDPHHIASLRSLAVLDYEAGLYDIAELQLQEALVRDPDDGLCCYYLGLCFLHKGELDQAVHWGFRATRCFGTVSLGYDLVGRAEMVSGHPAEAVRSFEQAVAADGQDTVAVDHLALALYAAGKMDAARQLAARRTAKDPTALVPRVLVGLRDATSLKQFAATAQSFLGEDDFELLETSLVLASLGLYEDARHLVEAACVDAVPEADRNFMPFYYLAWFASRGNDEAAASGYLRRPRDAGGDRVFASRVEELEILRYAVARNAGDARAQLQLGCLLANLGRVEDAIAAWQKAVETDRGCSIAWRNLGLAAAAKTDLSQAESCYRRAIAARPDDQTLYRDLAEILIAAQRRPDAIELLEEMPPQEHRRAEITMILAESYVAGERYDDCVKLLESIPYFVNWEGQDATWRLFNRAHVERGRQRLEKGQLADALADFEAALTYPANLNVGRSDKPQEAFAQYWRGHVLTRLRRTNEARAAWQAGADGADVPGQQNEYRQQCREALDGLK